VLQTLVQQNQQLIATVHETQEQNQQLIATVHETQEQNQQLIASVRNLEERVQETQEAIREGTYLLLDPWNDITATSIGKSFNLRSEFFTHYRLTNATAQCMITGTFASTFTTHRSGQTSVILAHLLPRSSKANVLDALGMHQEDIDTIRNALLLCQGIEEAFDRKQVSFVPIDNPFVDGQFKMMIWEDKFKATPIYEGSTQTLGDFENAPLNLVVNGKRHEIFRRVVSYQAYMACRHWYQYGNRKGLQVDCDVSEYQGSYQNSRRDFADRFRRTLENELAEAV
jgi:HNH endonuclease